jgi:glycine/sarcosine N-methyltransferase
MSARKISQSPREYDASINWDARLKRELPVFEKLFGPPGDLPLLDAACGNGRQAIALAARGYRVVAIDKSPDMIDFARSLPGADSPRITWITTSFARLARRCPGPYAGIYCIGNSLSAANSAAAVQNALANFAAVLHPRGRLFIQVLNYARMRGQRPAVLGPVNFIHDGVEHLRIRTFDMARSSARVTNITFKRTDKWAVEVIRSRVLIFDYRRLHDWCRRAGLRVEQTWGSYAGENLDPRNSVDCIIIARRTKGGRSRR